jgi:hypothetical protein
MSPLILLILVVLVIALAPTWPYSQSFGYGPSGLLTTVLIVLLILMLLGKV